MYVVTGAAPPAKPALAQGKASAMEPNVAGAANNDILIAGLNKMKTSCFDFLLQIVKGGVLPHVGDSPTDNTATFRRLGSEYVVKEFVWAHDVTSYECRRSGGKVSYDDGVRSRKWGSSMFRIVS